MGSNQIRRAVPRNFHLGRRRIDRESRSPHQTAASLLAVLEIGGALATDLREEPGRVHQGDAIRSRVLGKTARGAESATREELMFAGIYFGQTLFGGIGGPAPRTVSTKLDGNTKAGSAIAATRAGDAPGSGKSGSNPGA